MEAELRARAAAKGAYQHSSSDEEDEDEEDMDEHGGHHHHSHPHPHRHSDVSQSAAENLTVTSAYDRLCVQKKKTRTQYMCVCVAHTMPCGSPKGTNLKEDKRPHTTLHILILQALPLGTCQDESDLSDTDPLELLMKAKKAGYLPSAPLPTAAPRPPAGDSGDKTRNSPNKPAAAVSGPKVSRNTK